MLNNKARQLQSDIGEVNNQMAEFRDKVLQNVDAIKDAFAVEFRIPLQSEEVQREFDRIFDVDWIKDGTISLPILLNFTDGNIIETEEQIKNSIQSILSAAQIDSTTKVAFDTSQNLSDFMKRQNATNIMFDLRLATLEGGN